MNKLLITLLIVATYAQAQTTPPPGTLSAVEVLKYQRQHDSMQVLISKRRKEIKAYNRAHPVKKPATKKAKH